VKNCLMITNSIFKMKIRFLACLELEIVSSEWINQLINNQSINWLDNQLINQLIIFENQRILRGEELSYDFKFDFEDENKIPCMWGAKNCCNWMKWSIRKSLNWPYSHVCSQKYLP